MKRFILTLVLSAAACVGARAQEAAGPGGDAAGEKRRDVVRLLTLSRGAEVGEQIISQSLEQMRKALVFLPDEQREKVVKVFEEEMLKEFSRERMVELVAPIYEKHLTAEDVKAMIDFYQTPLGKKMLDVLPAITREAYAVGQERGNEAGARAMDRIKKEGLLGPTDLTVKAPAPTKKRTTRKRRN